MVCAGLTDNDMLKLRELGLRSSSVEKALMILGLAFPDLTRDQLAELSIGERDSRLLTVREQTFGTALDVFTTCPRCQQSLELSLQTTKLRFLSPTQKQEGRREFSTLINNRIVRYRLPDSNDMESLASCQDINQARKMLLGRCVLEVSEKEEAHRQSNAGDETIFTPETVAALASQMSEQDPQAEVLLNLKCVECSHEWQSLFDIAAFFWSELESHAKKLLSEIYILARTFHWSEQDILELSPVRRRWYLEMATS